MYPRRDDGLHLSPVFTPTGHCVHASRDLYSGAPSHGQTHQGVGGDHARAGRSPASSFKEAFTPELLLPGETFWRSECPSGFSRPRRGSESGSGVSVAIAKPPNCVSARAKISPPSSGSGCGVAMLYMKRIAGLVPSLDHGHAVTCRSVLDQLETGEGPGSIREHPRNQLPSSREHGRVADRCMDRTRESCSRVSAPPLPSAAQRERPPHC